VRLVEAVAGEFLHQIENMRGLRVAHTARHRTADEYRALLGHFLGLLLAHGAPQKIRSAQGVAAKICAICMTCS